MKKSEQTRDRILAEISRIFNQPFQAPEIIRSQMYKFMCGEFNSLSAHLDKRYIEWVMTQPGGDEIAKAMERGEHHLAIRADEEA